jgi:preprotein translocase subunit YajC
MLDLSNLLIGSAWAQTDAVVPANTMGASIDAVMKFVPLFLIFGVFYFLIIRPQQKRIDAQNALLKTLKKGDKVVTGGGIIGTIFKVEDDDYVIVEIAENVRVKVQRSTISGLVPVITQDNNK